MFGVPRNDAERIANHYNVPLNTAYQLLSLYPVEKLLPPRGAGWLGQDINNNDKGLLQEQSFWWFLLGLTISMVVNKASRR